MRAPEPSDICWGNLGASIQTRFFRKIITWIATGVVLGACVLGLVFARMWRDRVISSYSNTQEVSGESVMFYVLTFLPSLCVVLTNIALNAVVRHFTLMEKHLSETQYNASVASKLTIAMFLNTAVIAVVIHYEDFYSSSGLVVEAYNILIANAVIQPLCCLIGPKLIIRKVRQRLARLRGERCGLSQREANSLFEGPPVDMPQRYAGFLKTYLLTVFYAPVLPISFAFCLFAITLGYWVDKAMLLRVNARPARLGSALNSSMQAFIPLGCVLYSASTVFFFYDYGVKQWAAGLAGCCISLAVLCFPTGSVARALSSAKLKKLSIGELSESDKTYDEAVLDFLDDYDRANPVTAQESTRQWVELVKSKRGELAAQHARSLLSRQLSSMPASSSLFEQFLRQEVRRQVFVRHLKQFWPLGISVK